MYVYHIINNATADEIAWWVRDSDRETERGDYYGSPLFNTSHLLQTTEIVFEEYDANLQQLADAIQRFIKDMRPDDIEQLTWANNDTPSGGAVVITSRMKIWVDAEAIASRAASKLIDMRGEKEILAAEIEFGSLNFERS